jgi:cis-L-3-hydroxyproline dehydratase
MLHLSAYERDMLAGRHGSLEQVCLQNTVSYAEILGATELCEVTKATLFCGAHNYLEVCSSDDFDEVFSRLQLGVAGEPIPFDHISARCYAQSCVGPCDEREFAAFGQTAELFAKNKHYLERARAAGVTITGSCAPYLTGWLLARGEHFVTTESSVTLMGNSVWGAMGNSDGIEAAFWAAICGRTPKWGYHLEENRGATHVVEVRTDMTSPLEWDLLGRFIGESLPAGAVPVISGRFAGVTFEKLRPLCTALAISSDCRLCHVAGVTPEARTVEDALRGRAPLHTLVVDRSALEATYDSVCTRGFGAIDLVSLGCPHYDIDQIKRVAAHLRGKKVHPDVRLMIWTVYPIKAMADLNGYTAIIEEAGGHLYTGTCPATIGSTLLDSCEAFVFDSLKQAITVRDMTGRRVYLGDAPRCLDAAIAGRWEETERWTS